MVNNRKKDLKKVEIYQILSRIIGYDFNENIGDITNENFLGFFRWNNGKDDELEYKSKCKIALEYFKTCFSNSSNDIIIVSSLFISAKRIKRKKNTIEYLLSTTGYILPIAEKIYLYDEHLYNDKTLLDSDHKLNELTSSFRIFHNASFQTIIDLASIMMESDIMSSNSGYLFFIIPKYNVVIYSHDDIGFGCYSMNEKGLEFGNMFIQNIKKFDNRFEYILRN